MSTFDEPGANHRHALNQVDENRQRALNAVSEVRKAPPRSHHPHLAPVDMDSGDLAILCTQAVVDYLLQLRPYRSGSTAWQIDFGGVDLPTVLNDGPKRPDGFGATEPKMWICRKPHIPLQNVSQLIKAANTTIQYSTNHPDKHDTVLSHTKAPRPARRGGEKEEFVPASPAIEENRYNRSESKVVSYKFVFPPAALLRIVELADEVAAELNMLAELTPPDKEDSEGF